MISVFILGGVIVGMGMAFNIPFLFMVMFILGLISVAFQTSIGTIMQETVSNEVMGTSIISF